MVWFIVIKDNDVLYNKIFVTINFFIFFKKSSNKNIHHLAQHPH